MSSNGELPIANMRPDPPDLRDRVYNPILRPLLAEVNARPFDSAEWVERVRQQGSTSACTGFSPWTLATCRWAVKTVARRSRALKPASWKTPVWCWRRTKTWSRRTNPTAVSSRTCSRF